MPIAIVSAGRVGTTLGHGLKLANVSPRLMEDYRADAVSLDQLMALAGTDDHAAQEAAYYDGSSVVAAYSQDQTVVRAIMEHDFALRRDTSFGVLVGVRWGV